MRELHEYKFNSPYEKRLCMKAMDLLDRLEGLDSQIINAGYKDLQWVLDWKDLLNALSVTYDKRLWET